MIETSYVLRLVTVLVARRSLCTLLVLRFFHCNTREANGRLRPAVHEFSFFSDSSAKARHTTLLRVVKIFYTFFRWTKLCAFRCTDRRPLGDKTPTPHTPRTPSLDDQCSRFTGFRPSPNLGRKFWGGVGGYFFFSKDTGTGGKKDDCAGNFGDFHSVTIAGHFGFYDSLP